MYLQSAFSQSESQPEPCAVAVVSREEKCVRRRSWFCVAIVDELELYKLRINAEKLVEGGGKLQWLK